MTLLAYGPIVDEKMAENVKGLPYWFSDCPLFNTEHCTLSTCGQIIDTEILDDMLIGRISVIEGCKTR